MSDQRSASELGVEPKRLSEAALQRLVNFDFPDALEDYVHRIGRTGRAESTGDAFTLMVAEDATHVFAIERYIGKKIDRTKLHGFNYKYSAVFDDGKPGSAPPHERKMRAVRLSGGYYFGPSKRRRR